MDTTQIGNYNKRELIGKGTFGKIFKAQRNGSETLVALKVVDLRKCDKKDKEHVQRETELLQTCQHKNLVHFIESFSNENYIYIVMELCNGGNLRTYIQENKGLREEDCIYVLEQMCDGLKHLHDKDIAHRDVKTTNILLQKHNNELLVKIGDFGLAKVMDTAVAGTKCVGSPYFMSPEMINGLVYDTSTDIWSLGCCAYEMATTDVPYEARKMDSLKDKIHKDHVESSKIPYCREMQNLIMAMMEKDKTRRPSVQQILAFLHQHSHTQNAQESKGRRKTIDKFAKTWSPGTTLQQVAQAEMLSIKPTCDTSGYDSNEEKREDEIVIVQAPVRMTEDEKDYLDKAEQLQKDILKKIGNNDVLDKINGAIERTKHMDSFTVFMAEMEKLLDKRTFGRCKCDLGALWTYRTELLKKNFRIAWS